MTKIKPLKIFVQFTPEILFIVNSLHENNQIQNLYVNLLIANQFVTVKRLNSIKNKNRCFTEEIL